MLSEVLAKFSINVDTGPLKAGNAAVDSFKGALGAIGPLIAGAAVIGGIRSMVTEMVNMSDELTNTSNRLGISTNDLQQWEFFMTKAGGSAADVEPAFRNLQKNIAEVGGETAKGADLLKTLGVNTKTAGGELRPMGEIATDAGLAIAALKDPAQKSKAALQLFGKQGTKLLPLFKEGRDGMGKLNEVFEEFGGGISEDAIASMGELDDATENYDLAMKGLKAQIVVGIAPALGKLVAGAGKLVAAFKKGSGDGRHLRNVLIGVGIAAGIAGIAAVAPWLGLILILGLAGLAVDELITSFEGGETALTDFLDLIFGEGEGKAIFKMIKDDASELWKEIEKAPTVSAKFDAAFEGIGGGLKTFFQTELPAAIGVATDQMNGTETTWTDLLDNVFITQPDKALNALGAALKMWVSDLSIGINNAIKGVAREVADTLSGVVGAVNSAAGKALRKKLDGMIGKDEKKSTQRLSEDVDSFRASKANGFQTVSSGPGSMNEVLGVMSGILGGKGVQFPTAQTISPTNTATVNIYTTDADAAGVTVSQIKRVQDRGNKDVLGAIQSLMGY